MVDLSRRLFLGGALAIAGATVIAKPAEALAPLPRIVGDGVHDDTAGIQALIEGREVNIAGDAVCVKDGGEVRMNGGSFKITSTLTFTDENCRSFDGSGSTFIASEGFTGPMIRFESKERPIGPMVFGNFADLCSKHTFSGVRGCLP